MAARRGCPARPLSLGSAVCPAPAGQSSRSYHHCHHYHHHHHDCHHHHHDHHRGPRAPDFALWPPSASSCAPRNCACPCPVVIHRRRHQALLLLGTGGSKGSVQKPASGCLQVLFQALHVRKPPQIALLVTTEVRCLATCTLPLPARCGPAPAERTTGPVTSCAINAEDFLKVDRTEAPLAEAQSHSQQLCLKIKACNHRGHGTAPFARPQMHKEPPSVSSALTLTTTAAKPSRMLGGGCWNVTRLHGIADAGA